MQEEHPDVDLYIGALDEKLNDHAYIVPGLGMPGIGFSGRNRRRHRCLEKGKTICHGMNILWG